MQIKLAYGKTGLDVNLPESWDVTIVEPRYINGQIKPLEAVTQSLLTPINAEPLAKFVHPGDRVGIIFSDISRPTPHKCILPPILQQLNHIPARDITLFNACGTHRANTQQELRRMLGDKLVDHYRIIQNDSKDESTLVYLGKTSWGHECWLNEALIKCDKKILTGFIEPHFFAGFSGGGKAIMPGMAGLRTILGNHDVDHIGHPKATWGITQGNPVWEEVNEVAQMVDNTFLVNVTLNRDKQITRVFSGEVKSAHRAGCDFVKQSAMVPVPHKYDIVLTTNSGYPLDLNLYQAVKGMSAAAQITRDGGTIIIAAECWDGIPEHGLYGTLLQHATSPQDLLNNITTPGFLRQDQWQAQIQALIQLKAQVLVYSDNLSDDQIRMALLTPCHNIVDTIGDLLEQYGDQARICVLPQGPQTIPYVKE